MPVLKVNIKHAGKTYSELPLDTGLPGLEFKNIVAEKTGVPVQRMKVMVKGGILKDDGTWEKIAPKDGQTFTVIGSASAMPEPPQKKTIFVEDLKEEDLALATATPVGLGNLGNTCYMNATVQALRAIPELRVALDSVDAASATQATGLTGIPRSLSSLYNTMSRSTDAIIPNTFLTVLRQANPQFAELSRGSKASFGMGNYAQQDAEECYGTILNGVKEVRIKGKSFIEQFMMADVRRELKSIEAPNEEPTIQIERTMKLECNISITTNYMSQGITAALTSSLEKHSPSLGRTAVYEQTSRLTRLPAYLTVHMVRFAWRADVGPNGGKAKIMRRVKFPTTYDAMDVVTDEWKAKVLPASRRLQEIEGERGERRKVRKRTKNLHSAAAARAAEPTAMQVDDAPAPSAADNVELGPEPEYRRKEREELVALVPDDIKADIGCSWSGIYDLVAIITHKGAAADAGHYIGFAKKSALKQLESEGKLNPGAYTADDDVRKNTDINPNTNGADEDLTDEDEDWYKFDDQKVTVFPKEKLPQLEGGGEDSSAYVLIYRTKAF